MIFTYNIYKDLSIHIVLSIFILIFTSVQIHAQYDENSNPYDPRTNLCDPNYCSNMIDPCITLICNGDFSYNVNPNDYPLIGNILDACPWSSLISTPQNPQNGFLHAGTPDFLHPAFNVYNLPGAPYMGVPDNQFGSQNDHSPLGNSGYASIYTYAPFVSVNSEWREYIYQSSGTVLTAGQTYTIEFYLSLAEESQYATTMDVLLTQNPPSFSSGYSGPLTATPNFTTPIETNYSGWSYHSFTFTPSVSGTYYLVFGNFNNNANTIKTPISIPPVNGVAQRNASKYYIDDVRIFKNSVEDCCNFDLVIEGEDPNSGNPPPVIQPGMISSNQNVYISGYVAINNTMTFTNVNFAFGPGAGIIVGNNVNLNFSNCHLYACTELWQGIVMHNSNSALWMSNCLVEDAEEAAWLMNGNTLTLLNSTFTNNHIAVHLDGYIATWPVTLQNNLFNGTANLLVPRQSEKSEIGILVDNVNYLGIMAPSVATKNQFKNICKGIVSNNSSVIVSSAYFYGIRNYNGTGSWSIAMNNAINATVLHDAKVTNLTGYNEFVNCDNGIKISGTFKEEITYNKFSNINGTAIRIENNNFWPNLSMPQIDINNNSLRIISKVGIDIYNTGFTSTHVWRNRIVNPGIKPFSTGISIINPVLGRTGRCSFNVNKLVEANYTERFKRGIYTQNIFCLEVKDDTLNLRGPNNDQYHGIWVENCRNVNIHNNNVTGDYNDTWRSIGIRVQKTPYLNVYCNNVDNTSYALWFHQNNIPAKVYQNAMTRYKYGLALAGSGEIGPQVIIGANDYATKNWWDKMGGTNDDEFHTDLNSYGNLSPYYFLSLDPNINTNSSNIHNTGPVPFLLNINVSYALNNCSEVTTEPGRMTAIEDMPDFYREENFWMQGMNLYIEYMEGLNQESQEAEHVDSLLNTPVPILYEIDTLIMYGEFAAALNLNQSFTPGRDIEAYHQYVNELLIPLWEDVYNGKLPNPGNPVITALTSIANECPYQYGEAVYKARVFLHNFVNDTMDFYNACEFEIPKNLNYQAEVQGWNIRLYPNPAKDFVQVEIKGSDGDMLYTMEVRDMQGRIIGNYSLQNTYRINTERFENGVYLYTITDGINVRHGKLVIQK